MSTLLGPQIQMGKFDHYRPAVRLECPVCHVALTEWFGLDGPCVWLLWQQGVTAPVDQLIDIGSPLPLDRREQLRLPPTFRIFSYDCGIHCVGADCCAPDGTWADVRSTDAVGFGSKPRAWASDARIAASDAGVDPMRTAIEASLHTYRDALIACGATVRECSIEIPATPDDIAAVEQELGMSLPPGLRRFALHVSRRIMFDWWLPEGFALPRHLQGISAGGLCFDVREVPEHEDGREGWQDGCFSDPSNSYDVVWHNKFAFHHVANGDYLALDPSGRVIYLSHDDGKGHGYVMAPSFDSLMSNWARLGCPGPEDWQWLPFTNSQESGIDPDCQAANDWRQVLRIKP